VISAITYEVMDAVPAGLREATLALGATRWQTTKHVVLRKAAPGSSPRSSWASHGRSVRRWPC